MNRALLLKKARAAGYTGKADQKELSAWLTAEGIELRGAKGADGTETTLKFDDIWAKAATLTLEAPADAEDQTDESDTGDEDDGEKAAPEPPVKKHEGRARFTPGKGWATGPGRVEASTVKGRDARSVAKKAYELKARAGQTVYGDADTAEAAGAWFRKTHSEIRKISYSRFDEDSQIVEKAMSESVNVDGGILVPDEYRAQVLWLTERYGVARKLANVVPMARDYLVQPRKTGIVTMSPIGENATITATANTYDGVALTAKKWGALIQVSSELWDDSAVSIADQYSNTFAEAQAIAEDSAWILGDGSSTYNGCVGLAAGFPSGAYISATGSGWSSMLLSDFLISAIGVVEYVNPARLAFLCSRQFYVQVMLKLSTIGSASGFIGGGNRMGDVSQGMNIGPGAGSSGPDALFMGFPVYFSQVMPTATAGSEQKAVYFGDFMGASMIGDRRQLSIATSDQRYFDADQYAIRGISRFTTVAHGAGRAETYGPVVCLTST